MPAALALALTTAAGASFLAEGPPPVASSAPDLDLFSMEVVGEHGATLDDIVVVDGYAYLASGSRIKILDVSDPADVRVVHQTRVYAMPARSVDASGRLLVTPGLRAGGAVFDISDPTAIRELAGDAPTDPIAAMCTDGEVSFAFSHGELHVNGLSPSSTLATLGTLPMQDFWPESCAAGGGHVYATTYVGLLDIDVTDLAHPAVAGWFEWPDPQWIPTDLAVHAEAGLVLVTGFTPPPDTYPEPVFDVAQPYVRVIDVSEPATPTQISALSSGPPGGSRYQPGDGVAVRGDRAFVTAVRDRLMVIDLADPSRPRVVHSHTIGPYAAALDISTSPGAADRWSALVVAEHHGVAVVDVSERSRSETIGWLELPTADINDIVTDGRHAFVADARGALRIVDLADPARTVEASALPIEGPRSLSLAAPDPLTGMRYAYVLDARALHAVDVTSVDRIREVSSLAIDGGPRHLAAGDGALYVRTPDKLVQVIDTSDPESLRLAGSVPGDACDVEKITSWEHHVYTLCAWTAAEDNTPVYVVDVSDPDLPRVAGSFPATPPVASPSSPVWLTVGLGALYVSRHYGAQHFPTVDVYDLSQPDRPRLAGGLNVAPSARDIATAGDVTYVVADSGRLHALDASDPGQARIRSTVELPGGRSGDLVTAARNLVVVAGGSGLSVVRVRPDGWPVFLPAISGAARQ